MKKQLWMPLVVLVVIALIAVIIAASAPAVQPLLAPPADLAGPAAGSSNETPLLFLGNQNIPPVVYLDGANPAGIAVDMVHALAQHMPEPVEIRAMNWTKAQAMVARGDADALIHINPTEERKKIYDFSDPLLESHVSIFTRADQMGISGLSSLRGLRVGVEAGGLPQHLLETDSQVQLIIVPNFTDGFRQLSEGSVDAVVVEYRVGSYVLAKNNIRNIRVAGEPLAFTNSSIAVRKGNTKLLNEVNAALHTIRADGTYQKIIEKWQPTETVFKTQEQITDENYRGTIFVLLILCLIAVAWMVTIKKELTRRKAAEETLREHYSTLRGIIDNTNALIFSVDRHYRYTSFNRGHATSMKALYGAEIELGHSVLEYMTVDVDRETTRQNLDRALAGEQVVEETYSGKGLPSQKYFQVSHSPIRTEGEIIGVAVLAQDMTDRKRAEEELRRLYTELEQRVAERTADLRLAQESLSMANKKLNLLSGITRHDIKNQLLSLTAYLELSKSSLGDPVATREYIAKEEMIADTISRQISFTKEYEDLGVKTPQWQNVNRIIQSIITRLPLRNIRVDAGDPDLEVFADPLLEKVFYNLIDNALRYGGEQLTAVTVTYRGDSGNLVIIIEDDGSGISAGDKRQLFTKGFGRHTGLGLFLSREILSITGIAITETGEHGTGARFEMLVPKGAYRFEGRP
jgi:PAS domain S-box-containing protein